MRPLHCSVVRSGLVKPYKFFLWKSICKSPCVDAFMHKHMLKSKLILDGVRLLNRSWTLLAGSFILFSASSGFAQTVPSPVQQPKGQTSSITVQSGSKASLSFGTSTSFGTSANLSATEGSKIEVNARMSPQAGSITSSIGQGPNGNTEGITTAKIGNLRATGSGQTSINGSPINASDATFSSGDATLSGVTAKIGLELNPGQTSFLVNAATLHDVSGRNMSSNNQIVSGSANSNINSTTNVDIQTNNFTSTFSQTF